MTEEMQGRQQKRKRLWLALAAGLAILVVLIVPPLVSVSNYKAQIVHLISASLGRPARASSVQVRLLPRPGFILYDLTVEEDPAYGAEPVFHASEVTASIRLLSLWRGRLEIDSISADEASLNLVRIASGHWNLDSILRSAAAQAQSTARRGTVKLPYLEAKNSRINIKNGVEKLPFSLLDAKMSLEQQRPGEWHVRLRGEPVRTDLSLQEADTGILRLEATLHQASQLRQMPLHLDLEWREAQLGQLTRLLLGSDVGWRGDLTGNLHLDGTAEAAQIKAQLRATGVHRAEFTPASPLDFDANCALVAHFSARSFDHLSCDSPLGAGHIRLSGNLPAALPGQEALPRILVEMDKIPVAAALDALRTVRSDFAPGLEAAGSVSGSLAYAPVAAEAATPEPPLRHGRALAAKLHPVLPQPLTGALAVQGFQLKGGGLGEPISIPKLLLEPDPAVANQPSKESLALVSTAAISAGGAIPLTVSTRLAFSGYQVTVRGQASIARGRELAHMVGLAHASSLNAFAGAPLFIDLTAEGPWMLPEIPVQRSSHPFPSVGTPPSVATSALPPPVQGDSLTGTVTLRNATWKADYLVNPVGISQATLHLAPGELRWDPVVFSYGPLKGTATLSLPVACEASESCAPAFQVQFGTVEASVLQRAFLGAQKKGALLATLLERLRLRSVPAWPQLEGTIKAEALLLGPITLRDAVANISTLANGAEITSFDAALLGGRVHGAGTIHTSAKPADKPSYAFEGKFENLHPQAVGQLFGWRSSGRAFDGNGNLALSGFTGDDLAASAKGTLHFDWQRGAISGANLPSALARFDHWTSDAEVADGALVLKQSQTQRGAKIVPIEASVTLAIPPKIAFPAAKQLPAKR
jgi:hypothetical protein